MQFSFVGTEGSSRPIKQSLRKLAHPINRDFLAIKIENVHLKILIFFLFLLKTEAVLTSTHNLGFWGKNKKNRYTPAYHSFAIYINGIQ